MSESSPPPAAMTTEKAYDPQVSKASAGGFRNSPVFKVYLCIYGLFTVLALLLAVQYIFWLFEPCGTDQSMCLRDLLGRIGLVYVFISGVTLRDVLTELNGKQPNKYRPVFLHILFVLVAVGTVPISSGFLDEGNFTKEYQLEPMSYVISLLLSLLFVIALNVLARYRIVKLMNRVLLGFVALYVFWFLVIPYFYFVIDMFYQVPVID